MGSKRPDNRVAFTMHRDGENVPEMYRGFGSINASGVPEYLDPWDAIYSLNFTNRQGVFGTTQGLLTTRPGYADQPKYGFPAYAGDPGAGYSYVTRALKKWYPTDGLFANGQAVRLKYDALQKLDGAGGWTDIVTGLDTGGYPEMVVFGVPNKVLVMPHQTEGLMCWDGTNFWKQSIPQGGGGGDISGCMIVAQVGGKMFVMGDYFDAGESLSVYYCAAGQLGIHTDPTNTSWWEAGKGGGMFKVYATHSRDRRSDPMRITGAAEMQGRLIIFTETGRYIVNNPGTGYETVAYEPGAGCLFGGLIAAYMGRIYWWDTDNCYEYYGGDPLPIGDPISPISKHAKFTNDAGTELTVQQWNSFVFHGQIWFNIKTSGLRGISGDYVNTNLVFDVRRRGWYLFDIPICSATVAESGRDLAALYFSSPEPRSGNYKIHRYAQDDQAAGAAVYGDDGRDVEFIWKTGKIGGHQRMGAKKFWFLRVNQEVENVTSLGYASVLQYVNNDDKLPGTISISNVAPIPPAADLRKKVTGVGTKFLRDLRVGQWISAKDNPLERGQIAAIVSHTEATLVANWDASYTNLVNAEWGAFWKVDWPTDPTRTPIEKFGLNQTAGTRTTFDFYVKGQGRLSIKEMELIYEDLPMDQEDVAA